MQKVVTISVSVALMAMLGGCTLSKQSYLLKGDKLVAEGKYEDAVLNYRKAIQRDPNFGEAYYRLGLAALKMQHGRDAFEALFRATQLLPRNLDAKQKFAELCVGFYLADPTRPQALYTQIVRLSDELLSQNPASYDGLMLKGYISSTNNKPKEAIEFFRRALAVDSSSQSVASELVSLLIQDGQTVEAERVAKNLMTTKRSTYGPLYDLMFDFYNTTERDADAERTLQLKVANNPGRADYILQVAGYYNRQHKAPQMVGALDGLLRNPNYFPDGQLWVGNFYLGSGDYAEALRHYQQGIGSSRSAATKTAYRKGMIAVLLAQGNKDAAAQLSAEALQENPNDDGLLALDAEVILSIGKRENADRAVAELARLVHKTPNHASLRLQYGRAYRLKGDLVHAREQLAEAIRQQGDLTVARFELADLSFAEHQPQQALQQAVDILRLNPGDRRAKLLRTRALIETGDLAPARAELTELLKQTPSDSEAQTQQGLLHFAEKNYSAAIATLNQQRGSHDPRVYAALASAHMHLQQFDAARLDIRDGLVQSPNSPVLLEQMADNEALSGHFELAENGYEKLLAADPKSIPLHRRMVEVAGLAGDRNKELLYARQAHALSPNDLAATVTFAAALAHNGKLAEARTEYERAVQTHPDSAPALNNVAFFLADSGGDLDEALRLARRALASAPDQPDFADTVGYIYLKKGMYDTAIQTFRGLARRFPAYAGFHYHLGLALFEKGEKAAARKELQTAMAGRATAEDKQRIQELLNRLTSACLSCVKPAANSAL